LPRERRGSSDQCPAGHSTVCHQDSRVRTAEFRGLVQELAGEKSHEARRTRDRKDLTRVAWLPGQISVRIGWARTARWTDTDQIMQRFCGVVGGWQGDLGAAANEPGLPHSQQREVLRALRNLVISASACVSVGTVPRLRHAFPTTPTSRRSVGSTVHRCRARHDLARGAPLGPDDGTISPWAVVALVPFAPDVVCEAIRHAIERLGVNGAEARTGFDASFNATFPERTHNPNGWVSPWKFGLNEGPIILMIENDISGLIWELFRTCPYAVRGLQRASTGGVRRRVVAWERLRQASRDNTGAAAERTRPAC